MTLDRGAQNPPGPAFDEARNEREAWRRQQIAALTPEQRTQYDTLTREHSAAIETRLMEVRAGERDRIIERMQHYLAQKAAPAYAPGARNAAEARDLARIRDAVPDYVDGKATAETRTFEARLRPLHHQAHTEISKEQLNAARPLQKDLEAQRDRLLETYERDRRIAGKEQEFRQEAKAVAEPGNTMQFNTAAKSWRDAVQKAARQESERGKDRDLTEDFNKSR